jgi:predicted amidohydrolase YtcJ
MSETTLWHNGHVWADRSTSTHAVAAKDGVIVALGDEALAIKSSAQHVIDLDGKSMTPGFGDGHAHPVFGGTESLFANVRGKFSIEEVVEAVRVWAEANPDAPWVRGEGYDPSIAPRGEMDARWLDAVVSDRPVVLRAVDYHTAWVNTKAMEMAGITADTVDPHDGEITRREDGTPMGTLREWGAWRLVYDLLPDPTEAERVAAVQAASNYYSASGVVWAQDAWVEQETFTTWIAGFKAGALKFRANLAWLAEPDGRWKSEINTMLANKAIVDDLNSPLLSGRTVKFFADGILEGGTAAVLEPYTDCPHSHGIPNWERQELIEAVDAVVAAGLQPHIHAIGDAGIRNALDAFEAARKKHGEILRPTMAHCQLVDKADMHRFKELGVIANFEPLWAQLDPMQLMTILRIGEERAVQQYRMATLLRNGAAVSLGSDWPVSSGVPMLGIGVAITRRTNDGVPDQGWVPEEKLTLDEALHAYTAGVAHQANEDGLWGEITVGARADVVTHNVDLRKIEPMDVRNVEITGTWLGGERVFG